MNDELDAVGLNDDSEVLSCFQKDEITYVSRTRFRHYDVLTKTRSKMTTAITFPRQNDTGSRARALCLLEKLVLVLESKGL